MLRIYTHTNRLTQREIEREHQYSTLQRWSITIGRCLNRLKIVHFIALVIWIIAFRLHCHYRWFVSTQSVSHWLNIERTQSMIAAHTKIHVFFFFFSTINVYTNRSFWRSLMTFHAATVVKPPFKALANYYFTNCTIKCNDFGRYRQRLFITFVRILMRWLHCGFRSNNKF